MASALRFALPLLALLMTARTLPAATFAVDDTGEADDASAGNGVCLTAGGKCTLRAAIQEANALAGADTITLPDLPSAGSTTHYVQTSLLPTINTPITITGTSRTTTKIESGGSHPQLLYVNTPGSLTLSHATLTGVGSGATQVITGNGASVTLDDVVFDSNSTTGVSISGGLPPYPVLTVTNSTFFGSSTSNSGGAIRASQADVSATNVIFNGNHAGQSGGAIYANSDGTVTITDCTFTGNGATFNGGGIYSNIPSLTVSGSIFTQNTSGTSGAGVYATGTPPNGTTYANVVTNCTFDDNDAGDVSHTSGGGGMDARSATSISGSTFSNNTATGQGAGFACGPSITCSATNTTVSGNTSGQNGGGIHIASNGTLKLQSSTITNNTANSFGGGGVYTQFATAQCKNTIVAGNHASFNPDCYGSVTSGGSLLVGDATGCTITAGTGDQSGTGASPLDPKLFALADNGGPTKTHALQPTSPAGDHGVSGGCTDENGVTLTTDQRGLPRSVDGDSDGTARCDVGAFEAISGTFVTTTTATTSTTSTTTTTAAPTSTTTTAPGATTTTAPGATTTTTTTAPGTTTTTTLPPSDDPVCVGGVEILKPRLSLSRVGSPSGDEQVAFRGTLAFTTGTPPTFAPATDGVQLLIEDLGSGETALVDLSHRATPVPGGTGCGPRDGWKKTRYRNASGALAPACTPKSAQGLVSLALNDRRAKRKGIGFAAKTKNSTLGETPVGPFRGTVVLGASAEAGLAGWCATHTFPLAGCKVSATKIRCK